MGNLAHLGIVHERFYAERIHSLDRPEVPLFFVSEGHCRYEIKRFLSGFDLVVSWMSDREGILEKNLRHCGVPHVIVASPLRDLKSLNPPGDHILLRKHASKVFLDSLSPLGVGRRLPMTELFLNSQDEEAAASLLASRGIPYLEKPYAAIHLGSGSSRKGWPVVNFAQVVSWLRERGDILPLFITGPAEERDLPRLVEEIGIPPKHHFHCVSLPLLAAILKDAYLYLGSDSGISHLAGATGVATFVVFGPTEPEVWSPLGRRVRILYREGISRPAWQREWQRGPCLLWPRVDQVKGVLDSFLSASIPDQKLNLTLKEANS
jgi:hypothetical protein